MHVLTKYILTPSFMLQFLKIGSSSGNSLRVIMNSNHNCDINILSTISCKSDQTKQLSTDKFFLVLKVCGPFSL